MIVPGRVFRVVDESCSRKLADRLASDEIQQDPQHPDHFGNRDWGDDRGADDHHYPGTKPVVQGRDLCSGFQYAIYPEVAVE